MQRSVALVIVMAFAILTTCAETIAANEKASGRMIVLISNNVKPYEEALDGFKGYLSAQGIQTRFDVFPLDGDPAMVAKALEKPNMKDVILVLALGSLATSAATKAITDIPIIAGLVLHSINKSI